MVLNQIIVVNSKSQFFNDFIYKVIYDIKDKDFQKFINFGEIKTILEKIKNKSNFQLVQILPVLAIKKEYIESLKEDINLSFIELIWDTLLN